MCSRSPWRSRLAVVAVAGVFLAIRTNFDPTIGPARLLFAFEAVIIGGLGSLWGTLAGGVILGVAQAIGAKIDPGWQILAGHIVFLVVLVLRPHGLFPRTAPMSAMPRAYRGRAQHAGSAALGAAAGAVLLAVLHRRAVVGESGRSCA